MFVAGRVVDRGQVDTVLGRVQGRFVTEVTEGTRVELLIRPDDIIHDDASGLQLEVMDKAFRGAEYLYTLRMQDGSPLLCLVQSHHDHAVGERIGIRLEVGHLVAFPAA